MRSVTYLYLNGRVVDMSEVSHTLVYGLWGRDRLERPGRAPFQFDKKVEINSGRVVSIIPKFWRWGWWKRAAPGELMAEGINPDRKIARSFLSPWIWKVVNREVYEKKFHLWIKPKWGFIRYCGYKPYVIDEKDVWAVKRGIPLGPALMKSIRTGRGKIK